VAAPMSFEYQGEQYVAVLAGWGGAWAISPAGVLSKMSGPVKNYSRLLVFKLGGTAELPDDAGFEAAPLDPPALKASPEVVELGGRRYAHFCGVCHGDAAMGGTIIPDLRRSGALESRDTWMSIVRDGAMESAGMVSWSPVLSDDEIEAIRQYVIARANQDKALAAQ
jgi:quinohemoprotein ethanol dehydrogenase